MKALREYILNEKLHLNKVDSVRVDLYAFSDETGKVEDDVWRTIQIPTNKFVIFKDMYRGNCYHIAETIDMLISMCWLKDDFENFNPEKDIFATSDDIKDITLKLLNLVGIKINMEDYKNFNYEDKSRKLYDDINKQVKKPRKNFYDNIDFLVDVLTGELTNKDFNTDKNISFSTFGEDIKKTFN